VKSKPSFDCYANEGVVLLHTVLWKKTKIILKANQYKYIFLGGNMKAKIIAKFVIATIILGECSIFTTTIY
jgi:hypothetical protein